MARRFALAAPVVRESALQAAIASTFKIELAPPGQISRQGVVWWSVDMAAYSGRAPGVRTARGCIAGIPDMQVVYRGRSHFIECKREVLRLSDTEVSQVQRDVAFALVLASAEWGAARTVEEALALLDAWGIPRANRVRFAA